MVLWGGFSGALHRSLWTPLSFFFSQFSRIYNLLQFPQQSSFSAQIVALPFLKSLSASPPLSICSFPLLSGSSLFLFPLILVLSNLGSTSGNFSVLHFVLENCFGLFLDLDCSSATQLLLLQVSLSYQVSPPHVWLLFADRPDIFPWESTGNLGVLHLFWSKSLYLSSVTTHTAIDNLLVFIAVSGSLGLHFLKFDVCGGYIPYV